MSSKVFIKRNFISKREANFLNKWTLKNCDAEYFEDAGMDPDYPNTRFTTRCPNGSVAPLLNYPLLALHVKNRIVDHFGLQGYKSPPSYSYGIVNGIGYEGGRIEKHIDPRYYRNTKTVHFNAITQQADEGGHTIIDGVEYFDVRPTDLLVYQVSEVFHEVTRTKGTTPRILWVFGFCLDDKKIEEIFK